MSLSPIGNFQMTPFGGNPVQSLGTLMLTAFAVNAFANIPMAAARDATSQKVCEVLCSPLPGGKEDVAEKVCQEVCVQEDGTVKKSAKWLIDKGGKVVEPLTKLIDCTTVCDPVTAIGQEAGLLGTAGYKALTGSPVEAGLLATQAAFKAACTTSLALGGQALCYACCGALKVTGMI